MDYLFFDMDEHELFYTKDEYNWSSLQIAMKLF